MNTQAVSSEAVPYTMEGLTARGDAGGRFFPGIKVTEVRGRLWPLEEAHHKFGVGVQPILFIENAELDVEGGVDFTRVVWPTSQAIKDVAARLLQSATMPNVHLNAVKWKESLAKGNFVRRNSSLTWPAPRREDADTEPEEDYEDTSGECRGGG